MKKALIITTVSGFVPQFEMNNVKLLQSMGYEVHYATNYNMPVYCSNNERLNNTGIIKHQIDFVRSPFQVSQNIKAYMQLVDLMHSETFYLVHCHTPMGGVLGRLAARVTKTFPVIYTAHGFHFFKGSSLLSWTLYYPVERFLARYTDTIITINNEDYYRAKKFKLRKNGTIEKVNGVGINTQESNKEISKEKFKDTLGITRGSFVIVSVGELSRRKNHKIVIKALAQVTTSTPIVYIICGTGDYKHELERLAKKLNTRRKVIFLGYRQDITDILKVTDCFVFPSLQEGLPVALMEAMAAGLPVICSEIRGNKDLIEDSKGGLLVRSKNSREFANAIDRLSKDDLLRRNMGEYNKKVIKRYNIKFINRKMNEIYKRMDCCKK